MLFLSKIHLYFLKSAKIQFIPSSNQLNDFIFGFSTATAKQDAPLKRSSIVEYLISSCGLSRNEATKAANSISHIKTFTKADAVVNFLKRKGFSDTDIKSIVATEPSFLCSYVEKTLELKLKHFQKLGLSEPEVVELITKNPRIVRCGDVYRKLKLLKEIVGSNQELIRVCKQVNRLVDSSLQKTLLPNVSLLRECGVPDRQIATTFRFHPWIMSYSIDKLKEFIERAKEFGLSCQSGMFIYLLCALCINSREELAAKIKLLKGFGWSEEEAFSAIRKAPHIIRFSEDALRKRMEFLLNEAACEPSYVAHNPMLLGYSLKKRIIPRLLVLQNLKVKGLRTPSMWSAISIPDKVFKERSVLPHLDEMPGLLDMYTAACAGNGPISSQMIG